MKKININECLQAICNKDQYTYGHCVRVAYLSKLLCEQLQLNSVTTKAVYEAALIHDIGKVMIPDSILNKAGALTDEEFAIMKSHTSLGVSYLEKHYTDVPKTVRDIVGGHHEGLNGYGYPCGLSCNEISIEQRIVTVCDIFDGIASKRAYRTSLVPVDTVISIMQKDGKIDKEILDVFVTSVLPAVSIDWNRTDTEALPFI